MFVFLSERLHMKMTHAFSIIFRILLYEEKQLIVAEFCSQLLFLLTLEDGSGITLTTSPP